MTGGADIGPDGPAPFDPFLDRDDVVAGFQIEGAPVRGQIARLSGSINEVLSAREHPDAVAALLGEAVLIAALVGHSLKFDGKLIVQASGAGPVSMLAADYRTGGGVRGLARFDPERVRELELDVRRPGAAHLLSDAPFVMTIDQGPDFDRYQSIASIEGQTLAQAAETYFERSEQVPTRIALAVARLETADGAPSWRAGGALLQRIAGDDEDALSGDVEEPWERASAAFDRLDPFELVDPGVSSGRLLYELFHEDGVRMFRPTPIARRCTCSHDRIAGVLASFPREEVRAMVSDRGDIRVTCEYCNTDYVLTMSEIAAPET